MNAALKVDAVWDIETAHWDEFVCGAIWDANYGMRVFREEGDMADALLSLPAGSTAWAHAGGRFDVLWLLDYCMRVGTVPHARIRMSGSSISSLSVAGGATFRDSYRLVPMSLRKAASMFAGSEQKLDLQLPCVCGRDCGGYCSISRDMHPRLRLQLERYLVADVEALRDCLSGLLAYCADHQLVVKGTVASSSWGSAQATCSVVPAEWNLRAYKFARLGYYGGRVDVPRLRAKRVYRYDRNSSYPAALRQPVPTGDLRLVTDPKVARRVWDRGRPGIFAATVDVPDVLAPPLPLHVGPRVVFPVGRVSGMWSRVELEHAGVVGSRVQNVTAALIWEREEPLLQPYVEHVWALRASAATPALSAWLKWLANSLTGAFAQSPEQDEVVIGEDKSDDPQWSMVGIHPWAWRRERFRLSDRAHVHFAAYLTARARVELHEQILSAGDSWCYSDTDSVFATRELTRDIGNELGQWKFEGVGLYWQAIAPKVYRYESADFHNPKAIVRAKGVPDAEESWEKILRGEAAVSNSGVKSFLVAARGKSLFERQRTQKKLAPPSKWVGARIRDGKDRTRPPTMAEVKELQR